MKNSITLFVLFTVFNLSNLSANQNFLCNDHHDGSIICAGEIYFQSNLIGENQASCYNNPELAHRIQIAVNSVQRDAYRNANGDFNCEEYHESTLICDDGLVYVSGQSDRSLSDCHQVSNSSRSMQEAVNQALMEAAIDTAVREAAQR